MGRARSEALAAQLADLAPDVVVTSLEPKAIETGEIVARKLGLPVSTHANLHEHDRSNILTFYEKTRFEKLVERFFANPQQLVFGRESADEVHRRFEDALHSLIKGYVTSNCLAVVAHGTVITLFVSRALGLEPFAFWKRLGLPSFVVLSLPGLELLSVVESVEHER